MLHKQPLLKRELTFLHAIDLGSRTHEKTLLRPLLMKNELS